MSPCRVCGSLPVRRRHGEVHPCGHTGFHCLKCAGLTDPSYRRWVGDQPVCRCPEGPTYPAPHYGLISR